MAGIWPGHASSHPSNDAAVEAAFNSGHKSSADTFMLYEIMEFIQLFPYHSISVTRWVGLFHCHCSSNRCDFKSLWEIHYIKANMGEKNPTKPTDATPGPNHN